MSVCRLCGHCLPPGAPGGRPDRWWCLRRQFVILSQNVDQEYRRPKNCRYFRHAIIPCEHQHGLRCLAFYIDEEEHENAPIGLDRGRCTQWRDCQYFCRQDEVGV